MEHFPKVAHFAINRSTVITHESPTASIAASFAPILSPLFLAAKSLKGAVDRQYLGGWSGF
jgi:hypothetical protein